MPTAPSSAARTSSSPSPETSIRKPFSRWHARPSAPFRRGRPSRSAACVTSRRARRTRSSWRRIRSRSPTTRAGSAAPSWIPTTFRSGPASSGGVLEDVTEFVTRPLQDAEVKRSVDKLLSRYYLGAQENDDIAQRYAFYEVSGLGYGFARTYPERLRNLKAAEVQAALRKYLRPDAYTRVAIGKGPAKSAGASLAPGH